MDPVISLALATAAFVGTHLALSHPLRDRVVARLGPQGFSGVYSLIAAVTLAWMILAYRSTPETVPLWQAPPIGGWTVSALTFLASILLVGSLFGNPAFPHPGADPKDIPPPRGVFAITRHPMNWSFMLWAISHIAFIGTARNLIVAGGILLLAFAGSVGQDTKKTRLLGRTWTDWRARTSFVPFGALAAGKVRLADTIPSAVALIGGIAVWALVTSLHAPPWSPMALLR